MWEILNLKADRLLVGILAMFSTICPGLLIIFIFNQELFVQLDTIKLILLSIAIVAPVFTLVMFTTAIHEHRKYESAEQGNEALLSSSIIVSALILNSAIIFSYWKKFSFTDFFQYVMLVIVIGIVLGIIKRIYIYFKK